MRHEATFAPVRLAARAQYRCVASTAARDCALSLRRRDRACVRARRRRSRRRRVRPVVAARRQCAVVCPVTYRGFGSRASVVSSPCRVRSFGHYYYCCFFSPVVVPSSNVVLTPVSCQNKPNPQYRQAARPFASRSYQSRAGKLRACVRAFRRGGRKEGFARGREFRVAAARTTDPRLVYRTIEADPLNVVRSTAGARGVSALVPPTVRWAAAVGSPLAQLTPRRRYPGRGTPPSCGGGGNGCRFHSCRLCVYVEAARE